MTAPTPRVYVNGALSGIAPWSLGIFPGTNDLAIGGGVGGLPQGQVGSPLPGSIDEASVYNCALAASDIAAIYNAGRAGECGAGPAFTGLINLDFGGGTASPKTGVAAAGQSTNDFWNYLGPVVPGPIANLINADGTVSPVSVTMSTLSSAGTLASSDPMYNAYVYAPQSQNGTLTLNGLAAGTYNVFAYVYDGNLSLTAGGTGCGTVATEYNVPPTNPPPWVPWLHYAFWDNVALSAGQSLILTVQPGPHNGYAAICGLQVAWLDSDGSGLPVSWEIEYFGHTGVAPGAGPTGDGLSNFQEYVLGGNPKRAAVPDTTGTINLQVFTPLK